jgi:hypothetical protein
LQRLEHSVRVYEEAEQQLSRMLGAKVTNNTSRDRPVVRVP